MSCLPERRTRPTTPCRRSTRRVIALAALLTSCAGAAVEVATPAAPVGPPGQVIYDNSCARCHGADLRGVDGTPALDAVRISGLGDQRLRLTIASGKGTMPAFGGLTTTQVDDLVAYLKTLR